MEADYLQSWRNLLLVAGGLLTWSFVALALFRIYFDPLSKFPGPKLWSVSRIPRVYHTQRGRLWRRVGQLHEQYGPVVRIAPDELSVITPNIWSELYTTPRPPHPKDPYSQAQPLNGAHSLFTAEGATHKRIRRHVINGLSDRSLREQAPAIEKYAARLVKQAQDGAEQDGVVDLGDIIGDTTIDTITDLTIGDSFLGPEGGTSCEEVASFITHARFTTLMNSLSRWPPLKLGFAFLYFRLGNKLRFRTWQIGVKKTQQRMELHRDEQVEQPVDFAALLLPKVKDEKERGISPAEFQTNVLSWIFASSILTTVALTTATYLLARHQEVLKRLRDEITTAFRREDEITVQAVQEMPYLNAVIKETIRLHHPTPNTLPRVVEKGGVVDGLVIPPKTIVGTPLQAIQNSSLYWEDPHGFHPERFLNADDPKYESRFDKDNKVVFQPFSSGPRNCVGEKIFLIQARTILAKMVHSFDWSLDSTCDADWLNQKAYLIFEPKPLKVHITRR